MFLNIVEPHAAPLAYSEEEQGRLWEVLFAEFMDRLTPYWYVLPEMEILLTGYIMLYNTEHQGRQISISEATELLHKLSNPRNRPNRAEKAHMFNYLGYQLSRIKYEINSTRETALELLKDPNPFKYTTERKEWLESFIMWWFQRNMYHCGIFNLFLLTRNYVPSYVIDEAFTRKYETIPSAERKKLIAEYRKKMKTNTAKQVIIEMKHLRRSYAKLMKMM